MKSQKSLIIKEGWEILVVLDACRYDAFKDLYGSFLDGDLEKVKSEGSETLDWLNNTFTGFYEWDYFSANPYINSYGVSFRDGWRADSHFRRIYDVWESEWSEEAGTVLPEAMVEYFLKNRKDSKSVVHFIQPHRPFLVVEDKRGWVNREKARGNLDEPFLAKIRKKAGRWLLRTIGRDRTRGLSLLLFGEQNNVRGYEEVVQEWGAERVIRYYRESLEKTLAKVKELVERTNSEVVVTTDHGESFGKEGVWGHQAGKHIKPLVEVPWLRVER